MKTCKGCKHYKKDEITRLIVCEFGLHESYCEKDKEDFAIEELEKIKAKMEIRVKHNNDLENYDIATGLSMALGILENHISELKGENK